MAEPKLGSHQLPWPCLPMLHLQMFTQVAEVMGKHYGMVPVQVRPPLLHMPAPTL